MASKINVKFSVVDEATANLRKIHGEIKSFSGNVTSQFKSMASVAAASFAGVFAFNKLKSFANEASELYKVQLNAEQKLTAALGYRSENLIKVAQAMQNQSTYGDEMILQAQAMVAAFVKEEDQIKKLTPAIMDLATAKNMDLVSAADLVTKTIASSTNALGRYGIEVEGAKGSTERIDSAINSITNAFGGMSEAMAQTDAGKLQQIENRLGDIKETLGEQILPLQLQWNELVLGLSEKYSGAIADILQGIGYIVKGEEKANNEKVKKIQIIGEEIRLLGELKKEQESIAAWNKGKNTIHNKEAYEQAISNIESLNDQIRELALQSKGLSGTGPVKINKKDNGSNKDTAQKNTYVYSKDPLLKSIKSYEAPSFDVLIPDEMVSQRKEQLENLAKIDETLAQERLNRITDPIEKEIELNKNKYAELKRLAGDNAEYIKQIDDAKRKDEERIEELKRQKAKEDATYKLDIVTNNFKEMASQWKVFGALYKANAIAQTTIDTYSSAQAVFRSMAGVPLVGKVLGSIEAASTIGAGLARVNAIRKQKFASGTVYAPGGWSTVGENGPEDMYIPGGAMIVNNRESRGYNSSNVTNNTNNNGSTITATIVDGSGSTIKKITSSVRDGDADELVRVLSQRASRIGY